MGRSDGSGAESASEAGGGAATTDAEDQRREALAQLGPDGVEAVWSAVVIRPRSKQYEGKFDDPSRVCLTCLWSDRAVLRRGMGTELLVVPNLH